MRRRAARLARGQKDDDIPVDVTPDESVGDEREEWRSTLIDTLLDMEPSAFERLSKRLLREAGFKNVEVLGRSGDQGIDGVGVYRISLVSFPTFFQCKRYRGSVGAGAVRDFRGAMTGRGEKGLLITTGSFTREARRESSRDGAPPIDLVDGDELCSLLKQYGIGVNTTERVVEDVAIDPRFFQELQRDAPDRASTLALSCCMRSTRPSTDRRVDLGQ